MSTQTETRIPHFGRIFALAKYAELLKHPALHIVTDIEDDDNADLSFLGSLSNHDAKYVEVREKQPDGTWATVKVKYEAGVKHRYNKYFYAEPSVAQTIHDLMKDHGYTWGQAVRSAYKQRNEDYKRFDDYGDEWFMVGVIVKIVSTIANPQGDFEIASASLWGIESDSGKDYFDEVKAELLQQCFDDILADNAMLRLLYPHPKDSDKRVFKINAPYLDVTQATISEINDLLKVHNSSHANYVASVWGDDLCIVAYLYGKGTRPGLPGKWQRRTSGMYVQPIGALVGLQSDDNADSPTADGIPPLVDNTVFTMGNLIATDAIRFEVDTDDYYAEDVNKFGDGLDLTIVTCRLFYTNIEVGHCTKVLASDSELIAETYYPHAIRATIPDVDELLYHQALARLDVIAYAISRDKASRE